MRERYREGKIQGVVIRTLDRLSRSQTHIAILMEEMEHYYTTLYSIKEVIDDTPMARGRLPRGAEWSVGQGHGRSPPISRPLTGYEQELSAGTGRRGIDRRSSSLFEVARCLPTLLR